MRRIAPAMLGCLSPLALASASPAMAQTAAAPAVSLDALARDVVANNPERQYYERQIATARVEQQAASRWADPEAVVEFG
jgi:outer membrane protein, heavy metal efflux system